MTNGNIYLPLANLTEFQKRMLDPATSAATVKAANPTLLANGMGQTNFTPPLKPDDPRFARWRRSSATSLASRSSPRRFSI